MSKYIFITGGVVSSVGKGITAASIGTLLKNAFNIIVHKEFNIRCQYSQVRMRNPIVSEVGHIIPDVKTVANFRPALYIVTKCLGACAEL